MEVRVIGGPIDGRRFEVDAGTFELRHPVTDLAVAPDDPAAPVPFDYVTYRRATCGCCFVLL